jgi:hypothetical protein
VHIWADQAFGSGRERSVPPGVALALAVICALTAGCGSHSSQSSPSAAATSRSTAAALVDEEALDGMLLSPAEISTAMGANQLTVVVAARQIDDVSALVSRPECLPIYSPAESHAYAGTGWTAVRRQDLGDPSHTHSAAQSVVLFPSARRAAAFFTSSSQSWRACGNDSFAHAMSGGREAWDVGPVANANGMLSTAARISLEVFDTPASQQGGGTTGQRVLTVRNNVVIDVFTDGPVANDPAATNIAQRIAAKVPNQ